MGLHEREREKYIIQPWARSITPRTDDWGCREIQSSFHRLDVPQLSAWLRPRLFAFVYNDYTSCVSILIPVVRHIYSIENIVFQCEIGVCDRIERLEIVMRSFSKLNSRKLWSSERKEKKNAWNDCFIICSMDIWKRSAQISQSKSRLEVKALKSTFYLTLIFFFPRIYIQSRAMPRVG